MTEEERELELRPNGKVWFRIGGQEHLCRRPTVGDLSKILELYAEMTAKERADLGEDEKPSYAEQVRMVSAMVSQWTHDALGLLTDGDLPAVGDLPAWAGNPSLGPKLITHWREVPLDRSGA